jgi:hypothetical protein
MLRAESRRYAKGDRLDFELCADDLTNVETWSWTVAD